MELERIVQRERLWPGFEPIEIPLAVFDGESTYLFRHPAPPPEFSEHPDGGYVRAGRHAAVTANSSAEIAGVMSATVMLDRASTSTVTELAAVAIHEAFHVFQRDRHPTWQANEVDAFVYPLGDETLLTLRRLETEALRRAVQAEGDDDARCWASRAVALRGERYEILSESLQTYERTSELNEGLAEYVELMAASKRVSSFPQDGFDATQFRLRAYTTGSTWALLLDRFEPEWKTRLEEDDSRPLDELMAEGGPRNGRRLDFGGDACSVSDEDRTAIEARAATDARGVIDAMATRRESFDARDGWRIVVEAPDALPLWPERFDPLNVVPVRGGLLHTRFLRVGNDVVKIEALDEAGADIELLTEGIGPHPLFNGVRRVVIVVPTEPAVEGDGASRVLTSGGVRVEANGATFDVSDLEIVVRLRAD